jgi:hypothetical protein
MYSANYVNYVYSMFILDSNNNYNLVPVYVNSNPVPVTRFFLQDTFSTPLNETLTVASSLTIQLTLTSDSTLSQPQIQISYIVLTIDQTSQTLQNPIQTLTYKISYSYDLTKFYATILPIFIVVNIIILVHVCIRTYIGYLNKRSLFVFVLFYMQTWSTYIFFFLLITSGYWFLFSKATQEIYILMPKSPAFYVMFYVVFGIMVLFRIITMFY